MKTISVVFVLFAVFFAFCQSQESTTMASPGEKGFEGVNPVVKSSGPPREMDRPMSPSRPPFHFGRGRTLDGGRISSEDGFGADFPLLSALRSIRKS